MKPADSKVDAAKDEILQGFLMFFEGQQQFILKNVCIHIISIYIYSII